MCSVSESECCCSKMKVRSDESRKALINRLKRIEGQVRGIMNMIDEDRYCIDVITQVNAITQALYGFNKVLMADHMRTCVSDDIKNGSGEKMEELIDTIQKFMR